MAEPAHDTPNTPSGSGHGSTEGGSRAASAFFSVQKFVIARAWSMLVLILVSEVGGFAAHKIWENVSRSTGQQITQAALLTLGLVIFWIAPHRARFMRRLCLLLVLGGGVLLGLTWGLSAINGEAQRLGDLQAIRSYWSGEISLSWLVSGALLATLMWGGRFVFAKWRETPADAARRAGGRHAMPTPADEDSAN